MGSIYTRRGDEGQTDLFSGERVPKTDARIEAYGTVDELNTVVGLATSHLHGESMEDLEDILTTIQNHLHGICADLANTRSHETDAPRIEATHVEELEDRIDRLQEDLEPLTRFILPGGDPHAARLHHARSVCRRAERRLVEAWEQEDQDMNPDNLSYLNRLSDLLFVMARVANHRQGRAERHVRYD